MALRCNLPRDESGATAALFALSLLPLSIGGAAAIDYALALRTKATLQNTLDASVLSAVAYASSQINANTPPTSSDISARVARETTARAAGYDTHTTIVTSATYGYSNNIVSVTGTATGTVPTFFSGLLGQPGLSVSVQSTASQNTVNYAAVSLVVDVSPSMAIAASASDIANLENLTQAQTGTACAFACHDSDGGPTTNYQIARNAGVQLRIDVVKSAAQELINYISNHQQMWGQYTAALYSVASDAKTIVPPTTSLSNVASAITTVDFDTMSTLAPTLPNPAPGNLASGDSASHYSDTDFARSLSTLNAAIPANGDGSTPTTRAQYVFIVTDGLDDTGVLYNPSVSPQYNYPTIPNYAGGNFAGKLTKPLDPTVCSALKSRGVQLGVLYVTYVPDTTEYWYQQLVQTNAPPSQLVTNLTNCASPGLFYQANDSAAIATGLMTLFKSVMLTTRLTR